MCLSLTLGLNACRGHTAWGVTNTEILSLLFCSLPPVTGAVVCR